MLYKFGCFLKNSKKKNRKYTYDSQRYACTRQRAFLDAFVHRHDTFFLLGPKLIDRAKFDRSGMNVWIQWWVRNNPNY